MKEAFNIFVDNSKIVFSVDIKQVKNKDNEWKKKVFFPENWENSQLDETNYNEQKNGIAMLTGKSNGIFVIDVDNIQHWHDFLVENTRKEPNTVKAISASGGIHLYFKYSDELENIKTSTHSFGKEYDIDIRNNGGCIFVPPTSYYDNKTKKMISYKWVKSLLDEEPSDVPKWLLLKLIKKSEIPNKIPKDIIVKPIIKPRILNKISIPKDAIVGSAKKCKTSKKIPKDIVIPVKNIKKTKTVKSDTSDHNNEDLDNNNDDLDNNDDVSVDYDNDELEKLLSMLSKDRVNDYDDWITIGMAIYNTTNSHGFSIWDEWSKKSQKYDYNECKRKWTSFKRNSSQKVTLGTIVYWCKEDNPELYNEFKIKRKSDKMIIQKYPELELDLGGTIEVSGRKCTYLNNNNCVFIGKPHNGYEKTMFVEVHNGIMEIRCTHLDCIGKTFPCPPIRLTKNEMNIMNYGTVNVTINNNYSNNDEQLIEFQKYEIFENETVNELVYKSLTGAHMPMANIIYYYYNEKYNVGEDNNWYMYENHKWNLIGLNNDYFSTEIEEKLELIYDQLIDYGKQTKMDCDKIKEFKKISKMFGVAQSKRDIMSVTKEKFRAKNNKNRDFVQSLNSNKNLIVFKNGVYDLKTHVFRDGVPSDNMSMSVNYNYRAKHSKKYGELLQFLEDIQPNEEEREFLLTYLSHALYENMLEWFTILTGAGRNGKSKLIELIKKTFGDYYGSVKSQMFTRPQPDASSPDPGLLNLQHKKIVIASEPEKRAKLNSGFIKFITGRDSTQLRECHKNEMRDFDPRFITLFVCNDIPETDEIDTAFSKRLRCINFPTEFCDNPVNANQKQIDTNINEKFDEWRADFMLLLIEHFEKYMETKKIVITENILKWTNKYKEETDIYLNFFAECTENADTHIHMTTLYEAFKTWFVTNNPKTHIPTNREFAPNVKKHKEVEKVRVGKISNGIKNLKLIAEYE